MGKILFLDVDGTLVDYENQIPDSAITAVRQARANGHRVYICTGRSRAEIQPRIWEIGLDGMIGGNGSYVEDDGRVVMHRTMTAEQCREIVDWLRQRGLAFYLECNAGLFASEDFEKRGDAVMAEYMRRKGKDASGICVRNTLVGVVFGGNLYRNDVNKISYILESPADYQAARERFPYMQNGTWGGKGETALFGDFGVPGITKAHAIDVLLAHLGVRREDTIAFGDAKVDIPMLAYCAYGVAMGSGGEEIKAMADYVTGDVEKDGLYDAFVYLGLISARKEQMT